VPESGTTLTFSGELNCSTLALQLGYFDQAHLINDFRSITGYSPIEYQRAEQGLPATRRRP
jgi:AraC-like DNA-binding protein